MKRLCELPLVIHGDPAPQDEDGGYGTSSMRCHRPCQIRRDAPPWRRRRGARVEVGRQLGPPVPERRGARLATRRSSRSRGAPLRRPGRCRARAPRAPHYLEGPAGLVTSSRALDGALGGDGGALGARPARELRRGLLALGQVRRRGDGVLVLLALAQGRLDGREVADLVVDGRGRPRSRARRAPSLIKQLVRAGPEP